MSSENASLRSFLISKKDTVDWIRIYGAVAAGGESVRFEDYSEQLQKWYAVTAYCSDKGQFVSIFEDISRRKFDQEALRQQREWLSVIPQQLSGDAVIATDTNRKDFFP